MTRSQRGEVGFFCVAMGFCQTDRLPSFLSSVFVEEKKEEESAITFPPLPSSSSRRRARRRGWGEDVTLAASRGGGRRSRGAPNQTNGKARRRSAYRRASAGTAVNFESELPRGATHLRCAAEFPTLSPIGSSFFIFSARSHHRLPLRCVIIFTFALIC